MTLEKPLGLGEGPAFEYSQEPWDLLFYEQRKRSQYN